MMRTGLKILHDHSVPSLKHKSWNQFNENGKGKLLLVWLVLITSHVSRFTFKCHRMKSASTSYLSSLRPQDRRFSITLYYYAPKPVLQWSMFFSFWERISHRPVYLSSNLLSNQHEPKSPAPQISHPQCWTYRSV